eukprot:3046372-Pyramimonas_sp.AAC.1
MCAHPFALCTLLLLSFSKSILSRHAPGTLTAPDRLPRVGGRGNARQWTTRLEPETSRKLLAPSRFRINQAYPSLMIFQAVYGVWSSSEPKIVSSAPKVTTATMTSLSHSCGSHTSTMHQMRSGMIRGSRVTSRSPVMPVPSRGRLRVRMARAPWEKTDDGVLNARTLLALLKIFTRVYWC